MDKYYLSLGIFVTTYAVTEDMLLALLSNVAGTTRADAKALFSGARVRDSIGFIRRLHEARAKEVPAYLDKAFSHLATITTARDHLLHWGVNEVGDGTMQVSNVLRAHADRSLQVIPMSAQIIQQMTFDLVTINACAAQFMVAKFPKKTGTKTTAGTTTLENLSQRPGLYKPSQLDTKRPQSQPKPRKPKPQRRSSQA